MGRKLEVATIHGIGAREEQQDSFGRTENTAEWEKKHGRFFVLADGMGGMSGGAQISMAAVVSCLKSFDEQEEMIFDSSFLRNTLQHANDVICDGMQRNGIVGGTTIILVWIYKNQLYWATIGDSHLYHYRNRMLRQLNHDHNYAAKLQEFVNEGLLSEEDAARHPQRRALTSYLGMEEMGDIDYNDSSISLKRKDRLLLMSDGIFGTISEKEIGGAMLLPLQQAARVIEQSILAKQKKNQDNYTAILIEVR